MYALKTLKNCGLNSSALSNVTRSILFSILTYASPAWCGFITISDSQRLNSLISKAKNGVYSPTITTRQLSNFFVIKMILTCSKLLYVIKTTHSNFYFLLKKRLLTIYVKANRTTLLYHQIIQQSFRKIS